jgi:hypothetical protein
MDSLGDASEREGIDLACAMHVKQLECSPHVILQVA